MASLVANLIQSLKKIKNFLLILLIFNPNFSKMGMGKMRGLNKRLKNEWGKNENCLACDV